MKLFISLGNPDIMSGYVNVDPIVGEAGNKLNADPALLNDYVDNGECEEIVAPDTWDFYPLQNKVGVADHWLAKLGHGGTITVGGLESSEIARLMYTRQLYTEQYNGLLYGNPPLLRKSILSIGDVVDFFNSKDGYTVTQQRINGLFYLVTAKRN